MSTETDVKELAELKEKLEDKVRSLQEELDASKRILVLIDRLLSEKSFVKAAEVTPAMQAEEKAEVAEKRLLKRAKDGFLLGEVTVYPEQLIISISPEVRLSQSTPPFRSYFLGKILTQMREEDDKLRREGRLAADKVLSFEVEEKDGRLSAIVIKNYRDQQRIKHIMDNATWTLTRMLEKQT
ncbi:MAG: hypothetical protein QXG05_08120 [Nitrososphaerota archaeon]